MNPEDPILRDLKERALRHYNAKVGILVDPDTILVMIETIEQLKQELEFLSKKDSCT